MSDTGVTKNGLKQYPANRVEKVGESGSAKPSKFVASQVKGLHGKTDTSGQHKQTVAKPDAKLGDKANGNAQTTGTTTKESEKKRSVADKFYPSKTND